MAAQLTAEGAYASATKKQQEEIRDAYEALYKQRIGEDGGYQEGLPTIAPLTADQLAANQGLRGLVGSQDALRQEGIDLTRGTTRQYTPSGKPIEEYMSPYLRTALDAQKQQAQRQYERTAVPQFEAQAVAAGGMSGLGSRAGVEAAERATGQNMLLANIEASGQQKAYEAAVAAQLQDQKQDQMMFKNQLARETDAAAALGTSASDIYKGKASEYGLLSEMGKEGQEFDERNLEDAERRRLEEYNFPVDQLGIYAGGISGVTPNREQAQRVPNQGTTWGRIAGGLGAQLLGPAVSKVGGGIADWFGGFFKAGGQIPSPPAPIAPAQFQNNFLEKTNSPPMYNNTVAQPLGGLSSTMQAQPFMNISREGGGPVMPPMYYRAVGGQAAPMMNPTMMEQVLRQGYEPSVMPPISPPVMPPTPATGLPSVIPSQAEQNAAVSDGSVTSFADYDQAEKDLQLKAAVDKFKEGYDPSAVAPTPKPTSVAQPVDNFNFTGDPDVLPPDEFLGTLFDKTGGGFPQPLPVDQPGQATPYSPYLGNRPPPNFPAQELGGKIAFNDPFYRGPALFDQIGPQANLDSQYSPYGNNSIAPRPGGLPSLGKTFLGQGSNLEGFNSAMKLQPFESSLFNRQAGGPVMPIVYRQEGEKVFKNLLGRGRMALPSIRKLEKGEDEVEKIREKGIGSALAGIVQSPVERYQVDEPGDPTGGGQANFKPKVGGLTTLSDGTGQSMSDDERYKAAEKRREDPNSVLSQSIKERAITEGLDPQAAKDFAQSGITDETGDAQTEKQSKAIALADTKQVVAETKSIFGVKIKEVIASEAAFLNNTDQKDALKKSSDEFIKSNEKLFDKYAELIKKLTGENPYESQKFWFTVSAAIMKKGNAFANLAQGLKEATLNADGDRKEKNKLLTLLSKDQLKFSQGLNKIKFDTAKAGINLDAKQAEGLSKLPRKERDLFIARMKAVAGNKEAEAKLRSALAKQVAEETRRLAEIRKDKDKNKIEVKDLANITKAVRSSLETASALFGRIAGKSLGEDEIKIENQLIADAAQIAEGSREHKGKTGAAAVLAFLNDRARQIADMPKYKRGKKQ